MDEKQADFYQKLRKKLKNYLQSKEGSANKWADYLLWAPDLFHLLCKLSVDKDVPGKEKVKLLAAIAYFISPLDFIPEAILGPAAYADDLALTAYVLNSLLNHVDPEVIRRHWAGDEDVLEVIKKILQVAETMVGKGIWQRLKRHV